MKTSEALKIIYDEAAKKLGKDKARKYLTSFFSNLVFDLEEGHALEAETIEKKNNRRSGLYSKNKQQQRRRLKLLYHFHHHWLIFI